MTRLLKIVKGEFQQNLFLNIHQKEVNTKNAYYPNKRFFLIDK